MDCGVSVTRTASAPAAPLATSSWSPRGCCPRGDLVHLRGGSPGLACCSDPDSDQRPLAAVPRWHCVAQLTGDQCEVAGAGERDEGGGHVACLHAVAGHGVQIGGVHVLIVVPAEAVEGHKQQLAPGAVSAALPVDGRPRAAGDQDGGQGEEDRRGLHAGLRRRPGAPSWLVPRVWPKSRAAQLCRGRLQVVSVLLLPRALQGGGTGHPPGLWVPHSPPGPHCDCGGPTGRGGGTRSPPPACGWGRPWGP